MWSLDWLRPLAVATLIPLLAGTAIAQEARETVLVYATRDEQSIEPLLRVFEELTNIQVRAHYLSGDPIAFMRDRVARGEADLFIANDFGPLVAAKAAGLTDVVKGADFIERVPAALRDPDGHWFALTRRARVIISSAERVKDEAFTYESLAEPRWKGRLCMRSARHPYNIALMASMVAHRGGVGAAEWLAGVKANLAGPPSGGDRDQIRAIHEGRCDIAVVNSYYVGALLDPETREDQRAWARSVRVHYPNAADRGAHQSVSGMALLKSGPNVDAALLLMDFMTSDPAQYIFANDNFEFPVREGVKASEIVASWGKPRFDALTLDDIARRMDQARAIIEKSGFDAGPDR